MANFNFNKIVLGGRLTADPELKTTNSGKSVTTVTVAYNRPRKSGEETKSDFFTVTAWNKTAEFITQFFRKSNSICVGGSLQNRSWTDQNGQKRYTTEIVADEAYFVDSKSELSAQPSPAPQPAEQPAPNFEELSDDEELPF